MNAVIYARFSYSGQREESIEGQVRECTRYAEQKGYTIIGTYEDRATSGTTDKRPQFQKMIYDSAKHLFEVVICWKHDRFARNRYDSAIYKAKLKNNGVKLEYAAEPLSEGTEAIILDSVLEGYAEYYSANLSQNVKRGLYDSALKRQTLGLTVYGYRRGADKRFEIDPERSVIVKRIFNEYVNGSSTQEIVKRLNEEGYRTLRGSKFGKSSVALIISNPKYKGVYQYADIYDENGVPPIVSKELWEQANEKMKIKAHAPNTNDDYLLSGKLFCGHCGKLMTAGGGRSHTGKYYQYYQCKNKDKKPVGKDYIERIVINQLVEIVHSDLIINGFVDDFMQWQETKDNTSELGLVKSELANIKKEYDNIVKAIGQGVSAEIFMERLNELSDQEKQLCEKQRELEFAGSPVIERDAVIWYLQRFRDIQEPEWEKYLIRNFLKAVFLFDDGHLIMQLNFNGTGSVVSLDTVNEYGSSVVDFGSPNTSKSNFYKGSWLVYIKNTPVV